MNINRKTSDYIDDFLVKSNTGNIMRGGGITETNMFGHIDDRKRAISFLKTKDLDVFKRGTKMPEQIKGVLSISTWDEIKNIDPKTSGTCSMWD